MDSLISASARALAAGDALGALKLVALRGDPPALALRGIAMARLGELPRARELLREAAGAFGSRETRAKARCLVAEAEVALAMRDFGGSPDALTAAALTLDAGGDHLNAAQARLIGARRHLLLGRLDDAEAALSALHGRDGLAPSLVAVAELTAAELALRRLRIDPAVGALERAGLAAERAGVPALRAEVQAARAVLDRPAARRVRRAAGDGPPRLEALRLREVAELLDSPALVVDACRRTLGAGPVRIRLARRPVLFALLRALAESWPGDVERDALIGTAFRARRPDETHRARLRVELSRLRALIAPLAAVDATTRGFMLVPRAGREPALLVPPIDGAQEALAALLSDGAAWSTAALALALGASQRTVQRWLVELEAAGRTRSIGQTRARRWLSPPAIEFATYLLLPSSAPPA
ncbi:MAG: helix-turn-helix domain-containing protein [Comamonadaceae bacterium]|nr:MAG: helix-turn-helix domain-containing protein [Comamonadaceae bacterium]